MKIRKVIEDGEESWKYLPVISFLVWSDGSSTYGDTG
jgi:ABC-type polysaccharide/polyol phosphate export permease